MSLILRRNHHTPERVDRELDRFFGNWFAPFEVFRTDEVLAPSLDVEETENEVVVKAELPGLTDKDIDVSVVDDTLTIKGEKKHDKEEKGKHYHLVERRYGSFQRCVRLPSSVNSKKASARFKDGVLEITLPKSEEAKPKKIEIN